MIKRFVLLSALVLATAAFAGSFPDISLESLKRAISDKDVTILDANGTEALNKATFPVPLTLFPTERISPPSFLPTRMLSLLRIV